MGVTALIATAAALALPPLPARGIAVSSAARTALYDVQGRRLLELPGYRFANEYLLNYELPRLRDRAGRKWWLDVGRRRLVRAEDGLPLAAGATIAFVNRTWVVRRGGRVVMRMLPRREFPYLDEGRTAVSTVRRTIDLATRKALAIPKGCVLASRRAPRWILLCGQRAYGTLLPTSIEQLVDGRRKRIAGPAATQSGGPTGYWVYVRAAGGRLLAQWSGECESPAGFILRGGKLHRLGASSTESVALGWLRDGRAIVNFPQGLCGGTFHGGPGVYAVGRGKPQRLVATRASDRVALWD